MKASLFSLHDRSPSALHLFSSSPSRVLYIPASVWSTRQLCSNEEMRRPSQGKKNCGLCVVHASCSAETPITASTNP
jgi:hypothetical protein